MPDDSDDDSGISSGAAMAAPGGDTPPRGVAQRGPNSDVRVKQEPFADSTDEENGGPNPGVHVKQEPFADSTDEENGGPESGVRVKQEPFTDSTDDENDGPDSGVRVKQDPSNQAGTTKTRNCAGSGDSKDKRPQTKAKKFAATNPIEKEVRPDTKITQEKSSALVDEQHNTKKTSTNKGKKRSREEGTTSPEITSQALAFSQRARTYQMVTDLHGKVDTLTENVGELTRQVENLIEQVQRTHRREE